MDYSELEVYGGSRDRCVNCGRTFNDGEVISEDREGFVFCYSDAGGGCAIAHCFSTGKMIMCDPKRFRGTPWSSAEKMPNYPNTPVLKKPTELSDKNLWKRIFGQ